MSSDNDHASVQLPAAVERGDLLALGDQLQVRFVEVTKTHRKGAEVPVGCPVGAVVPPAVTASWKRFHGSVVALREATALRDRPEAPSTTLVPDTCNAASDQAWRACEGWLAGWTQHRDDGVAPGAVEADALYRRVFPAPTGMKFIGWRPRKQWSAMKDRMAIFAEPAVLSTMKALGGERLVEALRVTHADFGAAYGFTAATADEAEGVDARPQLLAVKDALRGYVKKVEGSADPDVHGSEALAAWLLGPFDSLVAEFASRPAAPRAKPAAPPTP